MRLFQQISEVLKSGGKLFLKEPRGHVNMEEWEKTLAIARVAGLEVADRPQVRMSHAAVFVKSGPQ